MSQRHILHSISLHLPSGAQICVAIKGQAVKYLEKPGAWGRQMARVLAVAARRFDLFYCHHCETFEMQLRQVESKLQSLAAKAQAAVVAAFASSSSLSSSSSSSSSAKKHGAKSVSDMVHGGNANGGGGIVGIAGIGRFANANANAASASASHHASMPGAPSSSAAATFVPGASAAAAASTVSRSAPPAPAAPCPPAAVAAVSTSASGKARVPVEWIESVLGVFPDLDRAAVETDLFAMRSVQITVANALDGQLQRNKKFAVVGKAASPPSSHVSAPAPAHVAAPTPALVAAASKPVARVSAAAAASFSYVPLPHGCRPSRHLVLHSLRLRQHPSLISSTILVISFHRLQRARDRA